MFNGKPYPPDNPGGGIPLSRIIQNVSFRYTRFINHRKKQIGHLFQGRYKALLIDVDNYLLELVRYIHNNPVRSRMVKTPGQYPWSSHAAYIMKDEVPWLSKDMVLTQFAGSNNQAVARYNKFVLAGTSDV